MRRLHAYGRLGILIAALAGGSAGLLAPSPATARVYYHYGPGWGWHAGYGWRPYGWHPGIVIGLKPPVVYAAPRVVYAPPPVVAGPVWVQPHRVGPIWVPGHWS